MGPQSGGGGEGVAGEGGLALDDGGAGKVEVFGMEGVGAGDMAFGGARCGKEGFGAGAAGDGVAQDKGIALHRDCALEGIGTLGLFEDHNLLEEADEGLAEDEAQDAQGDVHEGF